MVASVPRFQLLGPFQVVHDGRPVDVGGPTAQAILSVLLYPPDTKVLSGQLVTAVWGTSNGATIDDLYHYISRLRRALTPIGLAIVGHRPGYRLPVAAGRVDAACYDELLRTARAVRGTDPDQAVHRLRAALDLWRGGAALDNLNQPGIRRIAAGLDARRLDAEEDLAILELDRGDPDSVLDRLRTLAAAHPDHVGLKGALVQALHTTGRVSQARTVLRDAEQASRRQVGGLHPALLRAGRVLSGTSGNPRTMVQVSARVPFQLPADTAHFTGRARELAQVLALWPDTQERSAPATAPVLAVAGMAGSGKTALAVHAAHRLAHQFADGVLFVDLLGFTPEVDPITPEQALDTLLRGLGVPGQQIPPGLDSRVALYRTVLKDQQVLIVLDNAASEAQIRPLLPPSPGGMVLVTSRRRLAGLDEAMHLALPVLSRVEGVALFRVVVADRATPNDQQTLEQIVALCGHLPLAIRIAAAQLRISRALTPRKLLAELREDLGKKKMRLERLNDGDRTVGTALAVSYRRLTSMQQHAFRLLGIHPGTDIEPSALAALAGVSVDQAQPLLDAIEAASLIDQPRHRRYVLHDLVRAYTFLTPDKESEPGRRRALARLLEHYAHTTSAAIDVLYPSEADQRPWVAQSDTPLPVLDTPTKAAAWLDNELNNLLAAAAHAAAIGWPGHTLHQSATLFSHLRTRALYSSAEKLHNDALAASRATCYAIGEANALNSLGYIHRLQGRYERAADSHRQALQIARTTANLTGELTALTGLGDIHRLLSRYKASADCFARALQIARNTANLTGELNALNGLGHLRRLQRRYDKAADSHGQALQIARTTANLSGELTALTGLGDVDQAQGRYGLATDCFTRANQIARDIGDRNYQFEALHGLGRACYASGCPEAALTYHHHALVLARHLGQPADQARAQAGLAYSHNTLGHNEHARKHWQNALSILTTLGVDHTEDEETNIAAIGARLGTGGP